MQKSTTFLTATLILFFERDRPDSRQQNPACIVKTKAVQSSSRIVFVVSELSIGRSYISPRNSQFPRWEQ